MSERKLRIRLFGPFHLAWDDGEVVELRSTKLQAMLALLACAPDGQRNRAFLQDMLWSLSGPELGRASLRQAISRLKTSFGADFERLFSTSGDVIRLKKSAFEIVGEARDGDLLEGLDVPEEGLSNWLRDQRQAPSFLPQRSAGEPIPAAAAAPVEQFVAPSFARLAPAVAVLPFAGLDATGYAARLGDALAQDVTRTLSRSPFLHVISHLSCRDTTLAGAGLGDVRRLIDADYVVSGQIRASEDRFRLDLDFIEAATGQLKWSHPFVGEPAQFFAATDDVVPAVANDVIQAILKCSLEPVSVKPLPDVSSHALMMSAIDLMNKHALGSFARSRACLEELIGRAPRHATLHAWLARWYVYNINQGWTLDPQSDVATARASVQRALELNPDCSFSLAVSGLANQYADTDYALMAYEHALDADPNNPLAWSLKGALHAFRDEGAAAVHDTEKARALSPLDPQRYLFECLSATAYLTAGDFEAALGLAEQSIALNPRHTSTLRVRTIALQSLGRDVEARDSAATLLRREPRLTTERYLATHPAAHYRTGQDWAYALRQAGIPST